MCHAFRTVPLVSLILVVFLAAPGCSKPKSEESPSDEKKQTAEPKAPKSKERELTKLEKAQKKVDELAAKRVVYLKKLRKSMDAALAEDKVEEAYLILNDIVAFEGETPENKKLLESLGTRFLERRKRKESRELIEKKKQKK